jgi:ABC-2 type transport system permease protein
MRLPSLFKKSLIESLRDWKILVLLVTFAPFFVLLMYFYFEHPDNPHRVLVVNRDRGAVSASRGSFNAGDEIVVALRIVSDEGGAGLLDVEQEEDLARARTRLENKAVDLVVEFPENLSQTLAAYEQGANPEPAVLRTHGDPSNADYLSAAVWSDMVAYQYVTAFTGLETPIVLEAETLSGVASLTDFDLYVPGLLVLAIMMLLFTAAGSLIREKDAGTIIRLRLTTMTTFEWLAAVSAVQVIIGLGAVALTYLTALALGYQAAGSFAAVLVVSVLSILSLMALSVGVAATLRSMFDLLTIGCFPFFILMFFSGGMFPIPQLRIFSIGERAVSVNEILPTTHAITALNKILNYDSGLADVGYELAAMGLLTVVLFAAGTWLFTRRHMRAAGQLSS